MAVRANCPLDQSTSDMSNDSSIGLGISELFQNVVAPFFIAVVIPLQKVGEKEEAEYGKHDKQFDQDDPP